MPALQNLRSTLKSRDVPALQQALEVATQSGLRGAEVERAKQLLNLLAAACPTYEVPVTQPHEGSSAPLQPQLHAAPHNSSGGSVVPTQPQVHAARGSGGGVFTQSHGGTPLAMMRDTLSCLIGDDWKPGHGKHISMQLRPQVLSEMAAANPGDGLKCWCRRDKRMIFDKNERPLIFQCNACLKSHSVRC